MTKFLLFFIIISSLTACSNNNFESKNIGGTRFYTLSSPSHNTPSNGNLRIGVGPIEIPQLINRPQIVSRKNGTEIIMSESNQWAGSHREEIIQAIIDNLSSTLKTENVEPYPWKFAFKPNYQVRINIERFDGELGKNAIFKARWKLIKDNKEVLVKRAIIQTKMKGNSYNEYVKTLNELLKKFSQSIAKQIHARPN